MNNSLTKLESSAVAVTPAGPNIADMLNSVIKSGVTGENVASLEKLADLYFRMEQRDAEKQFNAAFVALQQDLPVIVASSEIPNRGKYERFEDVMRVVGPLLVKHGFAVSFTNSNEAGRVTETCTLRHIGGHSTVNGFTVRVSAKADSETQADCKAATTAKRNALLNALNIVIRQDCMQDENDPRNEGDIILPSLAEELQERVKMINGDEVKFLQFCGVTVAGTPTLSDYKRIAANKYEPASAMLARKERAGK